MNFKSMNKKALYSPKAEQMVSTAPSWQSVTLTAFPGNPGEPLRQMTSDQIPPCLDAFPESAVVQRPCINDPGTNVLNTLSHSRSLYYNGYFRKR